MNPTSKLGLLTGFCWLLVSCSEFSFVPQQTASSETENPETLPTESTSGQTQTSDASETAAAEVQTIPVAPRETRVITPTGETDQTPDNQQGDQSTEEPLVLGEEVSEPSAEEVEVGEAALETSADLSVDAEIMIDDLCQQIGNKLTSVSVNECERQQLIHHALSVDGRSLAYRDFSPLANRDPLGRVLVIGGIHGDEFSSVSVVFKWMNILNQFHSGLFHWRFIPAANPDGLLMDDSQRQNANGIDLNRNFPTADWDELAREYWVERTYRNPRRYPGKSAMSELETRFMVDQIRDFNPDIIISMHAPYHLVDYDGPPSAPNKLGGLYLRELGVYPGSLGNYFGVDLAKPIVTVELKSAGIMPTDGEIDRMWTDLVRWLREQLETD
jgi:protein MpaA